MGPRQHGRRARPNGDSDIDQKKTGGTAFGCVDLGGLIWQVRAKVKSGLVPDLFAGF